jgi:cystathionine beta-lyase/cystathionine gamma-synthase
MHAVNLADGSAGRRATAAADLAEDLEDLAAVATDQISQLRRVATEARRARGSIPSGVGVEVGDAVERLVHRYTTTLGEIETWRVRTAARHVPVARLADARRRIAEELRARQAIAAGVMVAADWHSPSIRHSVHSNAGSRDGRVTAHHDDYKRDRHPDESAWETRWLQQMVDDGHQLRALMTASGMAAFTTVLAHVTGQAAAGPILVGRSTYHECRQLLQAAGGRRVIEVPEGDVDAWADAIALSPAAVFVDSLCNAAGLPVTDVKALARLLAGTDAYLVVDNTALSVALQPWNWIRRPGSPRMIVFESLTKYPQLGFDRAAGGVIVTRVEEAGRLDEMREHLGTNIADVAVHQHPVPNRELLERRLRRIGRNAAIIADEVQHRITSRRLPVRLSHPGSPFHPGNAILADLGFHGGYMSVEPVAGCPVAFAGKLIQAAMRLGVSRNVPLCEGTSFGFDITRLYLTAATTAHGAPFLRIAAGAEDRIGVEQVAAVLGDALEATA